VKTGEIILSLKELDRLPIVKLCAAKKLSQADAAKQLGCGVRQVKRLVREYRKYGNFGLISKRRGKPSNNRISLEVQRVALGLVRQNYFDFSPTFAHEKLTEVHGLKFSVETLRQ
jgi:transposase